MTAPLEDKVAIVTGAASGIGRATAVALAEAGAAAVIVADVATEDGEETARQVDAAGASARFVHCDVTEDADVAHAVAEAVEAFDGLHLAFNNAAVEGAPGPVAEAAESTWGQVQATNLKGVWLCMKHEIPAILSAGGGAGRAVGGSVVNCAGAAGLTGLTGLPAHVASKHGVVGLTRAAALEYAQQGVRVNAVCPGAIRPPMLDRVAGGAADVDAAVLAATPMGRAGEAREVAAAVAWLLSDAASYVTGHALAVDGGWLAR